MGVGGNKWGRKGGWGEWFSREDCGSMRGEVMRELIQIRYQSGEDRKWRGYRGIHELGIQRDAGRFRSQGYMIQTGGYSSQ